MVQKRIQRSFYTVLDGGCGYILSRNAMEAFVQEESSNIHNNHIFEDVMVAIVMKRNEIEPYIICPVITGDK